MEYQNQEIIITTWQAANKSSRASLPCVIYPRDIVCPKCREFLARGVEVERAWHILTRYVFGQDFYERSFSHHRCVELRRCALAGCALCNLLWHILSDQPNETDTPKNLGDMKLDMRLVAPSTAHSELEPLLI